MGAAQHVVTTAHERARCGGEVAGAVRALAQGERAAMAAQGGIARAKLHLHAPGHGGPCEKPMRGRIHRPWRTRRCGGGLAGAGHEG